MGNYKVQNFNFEQINGFLMPLFLICFTASSVILAGLGQSVFQQQRLMQRTAFNTQNEITIASIMDGFIDSAAEGEMSTDSPQDPLATARFNSIYSQQIQYAQLDLVADIWFLPCDQLPSTLCGPAARLASSQIYGVLRVAMRRNNTDPTSHSNAINNRFATQRYAYVFNRAGRASRSEILTQL